MDNNLALSIIIPAHNCAKTLEKTVRSAIRFCGLTSHEILIIENGSSDSTPEIIKKLTNNNQNIKSLTSRPGVSNARNCGLSNAIGSSIMFLDADDEMIGQITSHELSEMQKYDLCLFNFISGNHNVALFKTEVTVKTHGISQLTGLMIENPTKFLTVWGKIFNNEIIKKNNLKFNTEMKYSEDSLFVIEYMNKCTSVYCYSSFIYHYFRFDNSTVRKYNPHKTKQYINSLNIVGEFIQENAPQFLPSFYIYGLMQLNLLCVHSIFTVESSESFINKISKLKIVISTGIIKTCLKHVPLYKMKSPRFVALILIKIHLYYLAGLIFTLRDKLG